MKNYIFLPDGCSGLGDSDPADDPDFLFVFLLTLRLLALSPSLLLPPSVASACSTYNNISWPLYTTSFIGALRAPPRSLRLPRKKCLFLPKISLTKAFPVAQICPNLQKIVPSSIIFIIRDNSSGRVRETALSRMRGGSGFTKLGSKKLLGMVLNWQQGCWKRFYASLDESVLQGMLL